MSLMKKLKRQFIDFRLKSSILKEGRKITLSGRKRQLL